ncbi:MAG: HAD family phosphatase [Erysipelotrichaceae bacterium]|nr:HAD family phosphatase [Erysipelotrichaceae bacterium]MBQ2690442.1 HAD family phosphatase [Solobacterium sp.]MBQ6592070.1 HAD family phosphatase [Solobacterium sp.]
MIKAVLFDMDGILYDSEPYYFRSFTEVLSSLGYQGGEERLYEAVGMNEVNTYRFYSGLLEGRVSPEEIKEEAGKYFLAHPMDCRALMFKDIPETLEKLDEAGISMACCSASPLPVVLKSLDDMGIRKYFRFVLSGNDDIRPKPLPDIYLKAAERLGLPAAECAVYEDSTMGIESGRRAGMKVYARTDERFRQDQSRADAAVTCAAEMAALVIKENESWKK